MNGFTRIVGTAACALLWLGTIDSVSNTASAQGFGQQIGIGYGPGYNADCQNCGGPPGMAHGCCQFAPSWTYHVWKGYECERPYWWYNGRPNRYLNCP